MENLELWQQISIFLVLIVAIIAAGARLVHLILSGAVEHEEDIEFNPVTKEVADADDSID